MKKKLTISLIAVFLILGVIFAIGALARESEDNPRDMINKFEAAVKETEKADIFVIIGTSLNVYPAAGLVNYLPQESPVYLIDPKDVDVKSVHNVTFIKKGASEGMKELMSLLIK